MAVCSQCNAVGKFLRSAMNSSAEACGIAASSSRASRTNAALSERSVRVIGWPSSPTPD